MLTSIYIGKKKNSWKKAQSIKQQKKNSFWHKKKNTTSIEMERKADLSRKTYTLIDSSTT